MALSSVGKRRVKAMGLPRTTPGKWRVGGGIDVNTDAAAVDDDARIGQRVGEHGVHRIPGKGIIRRAWRADAFVARLSPYGTRWRQEQHNRIGQDGDARVISCVPAAVRNTRPMASSSSRRP